MSISSGTQNAAKIFSIFGIPPVNSATEVNALATLAGPFAETYDLTAVRTLLNAALDAAAAVVVTEIETELGYWDSLRSQPHMQISQGASGTQGRILDNPMTEETIRQRIATHLGFFVPEGGFKYGQPASRGGRLLR